MIPWGKGENVKKNKNISHNVKKVENKILDPPPDLDPSSFHLV